MIIKHIQTEKTSLLEEKGFYTFSVSQSLNRLSIKTLIENAFKVDVESVNTAMVAPKNKSYRSRKSRPVSGRTSRWKKAIVKLKTGHTIDIYNNEG